MRVLFVEWRLQQWGWYCAQRRQEPQIPSGGLAAPLKSNQNLGDSNEGTRATSQCYLLCQLGVDAVGVSQQKSLKTQSKSLALGGFKDASGGIQSGFS